MKIKKAVLLFVLTLMCLVTVGCVKVDVNSFKYRLEFMVDGEIYRSVGTDGGTIAMPSDPKKDGFIFDGWFWDDGVWNKPFSINSLLDQPIKEENVYAVYAKFDSETEYFEVSFSTLDGSVIPVQRVLKGDCAVEPEQKPEREGFTFKGWNFDFDSPIVKNITVTAIWEEIPVVTYTVVYSANGGSGTMVNQACVVGRETALFGNTYSKNGYTFNGWQCGDRLFADRELVTDAAEAEQTIVLAAVWKPNVISISFNAGEGKGDMTEQTATFGESLKLSENLFEREGYRFAGWLYAGKTYSDGQTVESLCYSGTATLTAQWTANSYTLRFKSGTQERSERVVFDETFSTYPQTQRKGYTFSYWEVNGENVQPEDYATVRRLTADILPDNSEIILNAVWEPVKYAVRFRMEGYSGMYIIDAVYDTAFTIPDCPDYFNKTGYVFDCWAFYSSSSGASTFSVGDEVVALDYDGSEANFPHADLYCQFREIEYNLTLAPNGGTGGETTIKLTYEQRYTLSPLFSREGYTFGGYAAEGKFYPVGNAVSKLCALDGGSVVLNAVYLYAFKGDGSAAKPYVIDSAECFENLAYFIWADKLQTYSKNVSGACFEITRDIDMNGRTVLAIGGEFDFYGNIDGNNCTVSDFIIENTGINGGWISVNYGSLRNISFDKVTIKGADNCQKLGVFVGINRGIISNCRVTDGDVSVDSLVSHCVGGLVGESVGSAYGTEINHCSFSGTISVGNGSESYIGGLVGSNYSFLNYCYANAVIDVKSHSYTLSVSGLAFSWNSGMGAYGVNGCVVEGKIIVEKGGNLSVDSIGECAENCYVSDEFTATAVDGDVETNLTPDNNVTAAANLHSAEWRAEFLPGFDGLDDSEITEISTTDQLMALSGKTVSGTVRLTADIDLSGKTWQPITLSGYFDGNGKKISGLSVTRLSNGFAGFISTNYGVLTSLWLDDFSIALDVMANVNAGAVEVNYGKISYIKVKTSVDITTLGSTACYGGIAVCNYGNIFAAVVNCDIDVEAQTTVVVGGVVAYAYTGTLRQCITRGKIVAEVKGYGLLAGGLIGCVSTFAYAPSVGKYCAEGCITLVNITTTRGQNTGFGYSVTGIPDCSRDCYMTGTVDAQYYTDEAFLNQRGYYAYADAAKLAEDYRYAWRFSEGALPTLFFEA